MVGILIPLAAFLVPLVAFAMARSEQVWARPLLNDLARALRSIPLVGAAIANAVLAIEANLRHWLGQQVLDAEAPVVRWLNGVKVFTAELIYATTNGVADTARAIENLANVLGREVAKPVTVTLPTVTKKVYRLDKKAVARIAAIAAGIIALKHTATVTVPGQIAGDLADLRGYINRKADRLAKRVKRLERKLAIGALAAGLTWAAIRRLNLGWLKCSGVNKVGRWLCGLSGVIGELSADALLAFAVTDLCRFANGITRTAMKVRPLMLEWVDVERALIGKCGGQPAAPIVLTHVSRTPVIDPLTL